MILLKNLEKTFVDGPRFKTSNLTFQKGIYVIKGANGSGKTTLLKILGGIDRNYKGNATYAKFNLPLFHSKTKAVKTYLNDTPDYFGNVKAYDFLHTVCKIRKVQTQNRIDYLHHHFNLEPSTLENKFHALSLGQKKKIFLSITLVETADVWVMDEPENGLDDLSRKALLETLLKFKEDKTIIFSSHLLKKYEHNSMTFLNIEEFFKNENHDSSAS
ncbi:MAG: ATP-binding cassette domain-containing protein [Bacteriovoracaceae bacterium]|nr:ATP-binding cassette domain-containing protein [Bacteriovoracaceae bacterium]